MVRPNDYANSRSISNDRKELRGIKLSEFTGKPITDVLSESFDMSKVNIVTDDDNNVRHVTIEYKPKSTSIPQIPVPTAPKLF